VYGSINSSGRIQLDVSSLQSGLYLVRIETVEGWVKTERVVVN
jgi:hypothetical protein